jgi:hypothetical protein
MLGLIGEGTGIAAKVLKSMGTSPLPAGPWRSPLPNVSRDASAVAVPYPLSRRVNRETSVECAFFISRVARTPRGIVVTLTPIRL